MVKFAPRIAAMENSATAVCQLFSAFGDPSLISFAGGSPAREVIPADIVHEISVDVLRKEARGIEALSYGQIMGLQDLREEIVRQFLVPYEIPASPENIMITTGGLEGLSLTCQLFLEKGDTILVECPTFFHAMATFDMFEATCVGIRMDAEGTDLNDLEDKIKKYRPKMIYTIPTFQNPSGKTLPIERRKKIAELAAKYDVLVLEDDPYRELRYSGADLPPIKSFDQSGNVIFAASFSKNFSAGCRLGYVVANPCIMEKMQYAKCATNSHTPVLTQILCAEFFKRGYYPEYRKFFCDVHRKRRDIMVDVLKKYLPQGSTYTVPDGGLFTWVELPGGIDTKQLRAEAVAREDIRVTFAPGETFFPKDSVQNNCMRLSFSNVQPEDIEVGIRKLSGLIREKL